METSDSNNTKNEKFKKEISINKRVRRLEKNQSNLERQLKIKTVIVIACVAIITTVLVYANLPVRQNTNFPTTLNSGYEIFDMKGEKITTYASWNVESGDLFHIHVLANPEVTPQRMADLKDVLFSNDTISIDGQVYYKGWAGALRSINNTTERVIPIHFHVINGSTNTGNVLIQFTNGESGDGLSGYTRSIMDASDHQILKSTITIYEVNKLNDAELKMIIRHELGHAFGLAYSDNPNDLMHITVKEGYAYISQCDVRSLEKLYNNHKSISVVCEK